MNKPCTDFNFPLVQKQPWSEIFPDVSAELVDFLSKLLVYSPSDRYGPVECLQHAFFDDLRSPSPVKEIVPELFNFTPIGKSLTSSLPPSLVFQEVNIHYIFLMSSYHLTIEMAINPAVIASLIPEHARNETNWPVSDLLRAAKKSNQLPTDLYKLPHPFSVVADSCKVKGA
jgi:serine/threonine protein kinase